MRMFPIKLSPKLAVLLLVAFSALGAGRSNAQIYSGVTSYTENFEYFTPDGTNAAILGYEGAGGAVDIPETLTNVLIGYDSNDFELYGNLTVTNIAADAFSYSWDITSVAIPPSVIGIGDEAFIGCAALTNAVIADSVTNMGDAAFEDCASLASVSLSTNLASIGEYTFLTAPPSLALIFPAASLRLATGPLGFARRRRIWFCRTAWRALETMRLRDAPT